MKPDGPDSPHNDTEPEAAGFILAGGQSSRMGRDKARLEFAGRPLIAHALAILEQAGLPAAIAGAPASSGASLEVLAPVLEDATPGLGPLSGICAALAATSARYALFLPVDLPLIPPSLLVFLLRYAQITGSAVTVPSLAGFAQTFPVVLDRSVLPALQSELGSGHYGCLRALQASAVALGQTVRGIAVELIAQSGQVFDPQGRPPAQWFMNLNTPDDLARAVALSRWRIA